MFLGRSKERGDKTDDCAEGQEPKRFEQIELPKDGVLEQETEEKTSGSGNGKEWARRETFSVAEEQVA